MAAAQYANRNAVEVEGAGKNKAQLIVGIDFVSVCVRRTESPSLTAYTGYYVLRSGLRLCDKLRSQGRHYHRVARRRLIYKAEGIMVLATR
jgi:hypothetical protein